ncbi:hypothetical protein [Chitinophaga nivalis]|uniref:DUF885 domain-containing protein n=1 Tax=Chitinophaga nivalis TaxID=2991709 RepID=A0ABT3IJS0_9BACT|nr:hypothetical protein [Chitinophaga nivalis]MCW3466120.1 hypothetical protein [Chitinophaga nivalis]MCW3484189.1 hypothetical protein [Chitinophaga nivalis]
MKNKLLFVSVLFLFACNTRKSDNTGQHPLHLLAEKYVRLGLNIGQYDPDFVDAYYGPDSLKPLTRQATFPKDSFQTEITALKAALQQVADTTQTDTIRIRANWMRRQLTAFSRRIKIFSGEYSDFDTESKELFDVVAPTYPETHYQSLVAELNRLLPGPGAVQDRFQQLANRFIIPKDKLDTVFKAAIAEARRRTLQHYALPATENFTLEYVSGKPWMGYNWYKGNYVSLIQISADLQIFIEKAIDLGCHEGYPGHHVYNMLLEKNLYHDKGWPEISLYPLFSPQSLIAEGSANYGIEIAFPGTEKNTFTKNVLLPLAGLDTTGIDTYFQALAIKGQLNYARNEVGRGLLNGSMSDTTATQWLLNYTLLNQEAAAKGLQFIKKNRSYVINYNYGQDLIRNYIAAAEKGNQLSDRWESFGRLLTNEITPTDLINAHHAE